MAVAARACAPAAHGATSAAAPPPPLQVRGITPRALMRKRL